MVSSHLERGKIEDPSEDELRLSDAVLAAFCFQTRKSEAEKQRTRRLRVNAVYRAFAELRKKYPNWLQDMSFTYGPADTVPISGALEDILFDLGASGIMSVENPRYAYLKIPAFKLDPIRKAITERRNKAEQGELRRLADEFDQLYSEASRKG
jgi:hypothetical protein